MHRLADQVEAELRHHQGLLHGGQIQRGELSRLGPELRTQHRCSGKRATKTAWTPGLTVPSSRWGIASVELSLSDQYRARRPVITKLDDLTAARFRHGFEAFDRS